MVECKVPREAYDVVAVGAGFAGLALVRRLRQLSAPLPSRSACAA